MSQPIDIRTKLATIRQDPKALIDRIYNLFSMAHITLIDDSGPQRMLQVKLRTGESEDNVPEYQPAGLRHKINGETVLIRKGGHRRNTMAIATDAGQKGADYLVPGSVALDNYTGIYIHLAGDGSGIIIECNGLPLTARNCGKFRVEGPIAATGEVTAFADGVAIPLSTHLTQGIQIGSETTTLGPKAP